MKEKLMKNMQAFGKSLLLPFMQNEVISYILLSVRSLSLNIFGLIPVLFAISIAFGMAKK